MASINYVLILFPANHSQMLEYSFLFTGCQATHGTLLDPIILPLWRFYLRPIAPWSAQIASSCMPYSARDFPSGKILNFIREIYKYNGIIPSGSR